MHHPLTVSGHPCQVYPAQGRVKVVFRAKNASQQRLDPLVVFGQQGKPRPGILRGQRLAFFGQFPVQGVQVPAQGKKAVVEVGIAGIETQHAVPVDAEFLHTGIDVQLFHGVPFL